MSVELIKRSGNKYVFQLEMELDERSMLSSEDQIQEAVNQLGSIATTFALKQFDADGRPIVKDGVKLTSKGSQKKLPDALRSGDRGSPCLSKFTRRKDILSIGKRGANHMSVYAEVCEAGEQ